MMGARPLRRALQNMVEGPLSEKFLRRVPGRRHVIVDAVDGKITFRVMEHFDGPPAVEMAGATSSELVPRQATFAWLHPGTLKRRRRFLPPATGQTFLEAALAHTAPAMFATGRLTLPEATAKGKVVLPSPRSPAP